jgi:hypothetical protein
LLARLAFVFVAATFAAEPARASCPYGTDADSDGYPSAGYPGCVRDCDDGNWFVNPGRPEDPGLPTDDNCNGRKQMVARFGESFFAPPAWVGTGTFSAAGDGVFLLDSASVQRDINLTLYTSTYVALDVTNLSGAGCSVQLVTREPSAVPGSATTKSVPITGTGVQFLWFGSLFSPPEFVKTVKLACSAGSSLTADWLQLQDAEVEFPPAADLEMTWRDARIPAGGHTTSVVRDDRFGALWMGSDVAGVARYDGDEWQVANGSGATGLLSGRTLGVADILPMGGGSGEVYVLTGDVNGGAGGGLWQSYDDGETWTQKASHLEQHIGQPYADRTFDDDIAGDPRASGCGKNDQAGGRLLVAHTAGEPTAGDVIYIANADINFDEYGAIEYDNRGVSIWDGSEACALPNTGVPLPHGWVGALLRVDALPNETEVLLVGYRPMFSGEPTLYACTLPPGGPSCTGGAAAVCESIALGDNLADVRDLELDTWLRDVEGASAEVGVFVVDGGGRPTVEWLPGDDAPGCTYDTSNVSELFLSDASGTLAILDPVVDLLNWENIPAVASGLAITGLSLDPDSRFLFVNTPKTDGAKYSIGRAYRIAADDLLGLGTLVLKSLNTDDGVTTDVSVEAWYERARRLTDLDLVGAWLGAEVFGRADPFPARDAPGHAPDFTWLSPFWALDTGFCPTCGPTSGDVALAAAGTIAWKIERLADDWTDNEAGEGVDYADDSLAQPEGDVLFTFFPGIDTNSGLTYQSLAAHDVAYDADGGLWTGAGDLGLFYSPLYTAPTFSDPYGAANDCLWRGWSAGINSVSVVRRRELGEGEEDMPVVWATIMDQSIRDAPDHESGVVRSLDRGATWRYAAAGFMKDDDTPAHSVVDDGGYEAWLTSSDGEYGERTCRDTFDDDRLLPFTDFDLNPNTSPAHAFSAENGHDLAEARLTTAATLGRTQHIRAVDEDVAVVLLAPDADAGTSGDHPTPGAGGLYLTVNGGSTWELLDFDGDGCTASTTYDGAEFELRAAPLDTSLTPWNGSTGAIELVLLTPGGSENCALARVTIDGLGGALSTTWRWYSLPKTDSNGTAGTAAVCGLYGDAGPGVSNLTSVAIAPWSDSVMITGRYVRNHNPSSQAISTVYGGACLVDLNTGAVTPVTDPRTDARGFSLASANPHVADMWVLLPEFDLSYEECGDVRNGAGSGWFKADCPNVTPVLVTVGAGGITTREVPAPLPNHTASGASWSDLDTPDDSVNGSGTWFAISTLGSGTWRAELTW